MAVAEAEFGSAAEGKGKKKLFLFGGIAAGLVLLLVLGFVIATRGGTPPSSTSSTVATEGTTTAEKKDANPEEAKAAREATARTELAKLRARLVDDPEKVLSLQRDLAFLGDSFSFSPAIAGEFTALVKDTDKKFLELGKKVFDTTEAEYKKYFEQDKLEAAAALWGTMPDIVRWNLDLKTKWLNARDKARKDGNAWAIWRRLLEQVDKYISQDDPEIAIAILEVEDNLPKDCETEFPFIWERRKERLNGLHSGLDEERRRIQKERDDAAAALAEVKRIEEEQERERLFAERLANTPPQPLISVEGGDLENWTVRTGISNPDNPFDVKIPWSIQKTDNEPTLVGEGQEQEIQIGMNGNRWMDWVLECDVLVSTGTLHLKTRTVIAGNIFHTQIQKDAGKSFDLSDGEYGSWKHVRVVVRGKKVAFYEGSSETPKEEIETSHQEGGFIFALDPKGKAQIRKAQFQLVYDKKSKKDEDEGEE
jgi:hypothetical protein